jgi:BP28CT (NUC211) domain
VGKPTDGSTLRSTIISSGPTARGGRSRSYSFGKNENIAYLHPYPSDMQKVIVGILRAAEKSETLLELKSILCEHVLNSSTWKEEIFCHLSNNSREQIALSLIHAASLTDIRNAEGILFSLPLKAVDLDKLLASNISNANGLSQATLASDYIRSNASRLVSDGGFDLLIGRISGMLSAMRKNGNNDSHTFVRHALLDALLELLTVLSDSESDRTDLESSMNFDSWMDILVDEALDTDVTSLRTAKIAVSCLAVLCKISPKLILPKISRIISGVATDLVLRDPHQISVRLNLSVPVFLQYSSHSELIIPAMFRAFIDASKKFQESSRLELYRVFVGALSLVPSDSSTRCSPIGLFVVALLGGELFDKSRDATQVDGFPGWMRQLLSDISPKERLLAASTMQSFSRDTLHVGLKQDESQRHHDLPALNEFSDFDGCETGLEQICAFCEILSMTTYDVLSSTDLSSLVNASTNQHTGRLLLLWQECLLMQMVCQKPQVGALLAVTSDILGQTMNTVQKCLPPHVYLVFVTNLMKEGGTEIRSRAVQTIAERSQSLPPESPEATLFLEMIPVLLETINSCDQSDLETKLLRHSVFLAIDCIGRKFCGSDNKGKSYVRSFASVLSIAAESMWDEFESKKYNSFSDFPSDSRQLVSSAAICASTAAKICGQKAIPALPKLVPSLLEILSLSCDHGLSPSQKEEIKERADWNQARLVQLSILRALRTVITALPTMLKQYLVKLLNVVLRVPMRFQNDSINDHSALQNEQQKVVDAISSSIPLRQLIPAASLAISTIADGKSLVSLLAISAQSVKQAKTAEVSSQTSLILKMAFHAFEQKTPTERDYVWGATNDLVLCLVMKQSEVQFRRLYQKLLDWRSEGSRNYAFWQLSSFLSKQLKSIFLPCLTMVFSDVTEHLVGAFGGFRGLLKHSMISHSVVLN